MLYDFFNVNEKGNLTINGHDTVDLAKNFGTPLYVMSEDCIRDACRQFHQSIDKYYGGNGMVLFASKAFSCKEIYRIMMEEKCGVDVVSAGELYTALQVGFPTENIVFHGNNKSPQELKMAVENNVGRIIVDGLAELDMLDAIAKEMGKTVCIMLRIKPGIDAHTHNFIKTGQIDSKFGLALETGEALEAVKKALEYKNVALKGIHCHIGSQIFATDAFESAADVMYTFLATVKKETGFDIEEINLGGGFGIRYTHLDSPVPYDKYMGKVADVLKNKSEKLNLPMPKIYIEPGRAIVGPAGITLYTVGAIKAIPNIRTYVSIDGGMGDNPRYALYQADYEACIANKVAQPRKFLATIAGKCCESGDLIQENTFIQEPESGDTMAVFSTGAYNYSMASNYNRLPKPAVVFVKEGAEPRIVVKRETFEDIVRNDI